ncbi:hypothetical protein LPW11_08160 [Geomonas sp. RF6]|uniref:GSU3473 family protein n=1 Tax=Geomonas sp. RF6 TaxID=2897342 RepID=UPI001E3D6A3E|nr:hypothetical protein [Geomonas sp. RF6]UFS72153.1 hypothetical protein LPW11_08160 [Geomonas sp. RF6]
MLVRVRYTDNSSGTVDNSIIQRLVRAKEIREIRRSTGWVTVGSNDPRKERGDRRQSRGTRRCNSGLIDIYV